MDIETIYNKIKDSNANARFINGSDEILIDCRYCVDPRKPKMYIGMRDNVPMYFCQKCNTKGRINSDFLSTYSIPTTVSAGILNSIPKYDGKYKAGRKKTSKLNFEVNLPRVKSKFYEEKMDYFNARTGIDGLKNFEKYKIIFSFKAFIYLNKLELEKHNFWLPDDFIDLLDMHYIGFLSYYNSSIIFRNVSGIESDKIKRFYQINLIKEKSKYIKFFSPVNKELVVEEDIEVIFAEGIFDIINLQTLLFDGRKNQIFVAVLNKDYSSKINFIIDKYGMRIKSMNFYIDKDHKFYKNLFGFEANIFQNLAAKDYGEIRKKINLKRLH